jgi:FkbM family methyltransferase
MKLEDQSRTARKGVLRNASYALDVARLAAVYGPFQAIPIAVSLLRRGGEVRFRQNGRTYVLPNELSARYHLLESITKLRRLTQYVREDDTLIVDIGAHSGLFTAFALERATRAKALCVEPLAAMAPFLKRNLSDFTDWELVTQAVSDETGRGTFFAAESSQESSLMASAIRSPSQPTAITTITMDDLCRHFDRIDVMKIDVQGAEHLAVSGGTRTLPRVRTLLIEVTLADPQAHRVLTRLHREFGPWRFVNAVYGGADLVFERNRGDVSPHSRQM